MEAAEGVARMTREQQQIKMQFEAIQEEFLARFGWRREGRYWVHARVNGGTISYMARDAVAQTYANPILAMGGRFS